MIKKITDNLKKHKLGYAIGSLGWIINILYFGYEYIEKGARFLEHLKGFSLEHVMIFLAIPLFVFVGYLFDRRVKLEQEIKEYSEQLEQKVEERTKELKESEEKYKTLVEESPNLIYILQDEKLQFVNRAACERLGYTEDELLSEDFNYLDVVHPKDRELIRENARKRQKGEHVPDSYEFSLISKDGEKIDVIARPRLITFKEKPAIEGTLIDITESKKLEKEIVDSKKYLEHVLQTMPSGLFTVDTDIKITSWNKAAEQITGYKKDEVIGKPCIFESSPQCGGVCRLFDAKEPIFDRDYEFVAKDGKKKVLRKNTELLIDAEGDIIGGVESFIDVTEKVEAGKRLQKAHKRLEEKVEELERFSKLAVGRELKMIELKKEIKELKEMLGED